MIAATFSEFKTGLKMYLDQVEQNHETLIIKSNLGKGTVVVSLEEYNSFIETLHLLGSKANADRLYKSIRQMGEGNLIRSNMK